MNAIPTVAAIRFGYGMGRGAPFADAGSVLASLQSGNDIVATYPVAATQEIIRKARALAKENKAEAGKKKRPVRATMTARQDLMAAASLGILHGVARILDTEAAFFERLSWFWADHFTAVGKNLPARGVAPAYLDEAIRPFVTGRFADMLKAVITHPYMLVYLDQVASVGPNSAAGKRRGKGLNENLARELLELHTLGVGAGYRQQDVRQLAELLTGLSFNQRRGFQFNSRMSEPGTKTIIGKRYGGAKPDLNDIFQALEDLSSHPDTARHLARKLVVHFVSDNPDAGMVDHIAAAYLASGGDLTATYTAMLEHPAAWGALGQKAKQPFDFIASALVALNVSGQEVLTLKPKDQRNMMWKPLVAMGQPFMQARGPDGWPEAADEWITPQGLATRIAWSVGVSEFVGQRVSDPSRFLEQTLADAAGDRLRRAISQVERVADGVALVFASAEFNRR